MARGRGFALKTIQWFLRAIEFLCAALILGIFSYFLATLKNHGMDIATWIRAIEGISGAAALYTLCGLVLLCFVAGHTFFSLLAIILDICFVGAFIYIAIQTRFGANSCRGYVVTPFGSGDADTGNTVPAPNQGNTLLPSFKQACQLETACFAVSIVAIVFFLLSALLELSIWRHHRHERAFGPSPANNYTAGSNPALSRRRFWQRRKHHTGRDAALGAGAIGVAEHEKHRHHPDSLPSHHTPNDVRNSYQTDNTAVGTEPTYNKYGPDATGTGSRPGTGHGYGGLTGAHHNTTYVNNNTTTPYPSGYETGTTGMPSTGHTGGYNEEIPARQYAGHSVHNPAANY